jgi:hypothetical protein
VTREIEIERPASQYAELRGWFEVKIMQASKRGFPDRFYARAGRVVLVEYKAPGEQASTQQAKRHRELRAAGVEVHVIDNLEVARELFR